MMQNSLNSTANFVQLTQFEDIGAITLQEANVIPYMVIRTKADGKPWKANMDFIHSAFDMNFISTWQKGIQDAENIEPKVP